MLFVPETKYSTVTETDNVYKVSILDEVETTSGWKSSKEVVVGDTLRTNENTIDEVVSISMDNDFVIIKVKEKV